MFFSVINKNSNWEILTKNLVTFKEKDGVKKLSYFWKEGSGVFEGGLIPQYTLCFIFLFLQFYKEHIRSITWNVEDTRIFVDQKKGKPIDGKALSPSFF